MWSMVVQGSFAKFKLEKLLLVMRSIYASQKRFNA